MRVRIIKNPYQPFTKGFTVQRKLFGIWFKVMRVDSFASAEYVAGSLANPVVKEY